MTGFRGWPVWTLKARLLWPILGVELTALVVVGWFLLAHPRIGLADLLTCALLGGLGLLHAEVARPVERTRWRLTGDLHVELTSVWVFAAAVLVPTGWAALLAAVVHLHLWARSARARAPLYRELYTTATIVLSCVSASTVVHACGSALAPLGPAAAVGAAYALGIASFFTVNTALVAVVIALSSAGATVADLLGRCDENAVELAALSLGTVLAVLVPINPWLVAFVVAPLLAVQRAALVRHLEEAADVDPKTGLLNSGAWHRRATRELRNPRRGPSQAVLVLDLDHFKTVNDRHGHLAGDRVLAAVADAVRGEVREGDIVGRFGGEEFVVLLTGAARREPKGVAERLRACVADLRVEMSTPDGPLTMCGLTVSVGGAVHDHHHDDLMTLLATADHALYEAKRSGRNQVRMAPPPHPDRDRDHPGQPNQA